jgi:hypothetical protein
MTTLRSAAEIQEHLVKAVKALCLGENTSEEAIQALVPSFPCVQQYPKANFGAAC